MIAVAYPTFGIKTITPSEFSKAFENFKNHIKVLEHSLNGKQFLVGNQITLADLNVASMLTIPF
jgi:glutathione S-transferase